MLDWTPPPIGTRRAGRLLWLGVITVVLVTAVAAPSTAAPRSPAGPDITGDQAGRSSQWIARPPLRQARGGLGVAKVGRQILAIGGFEVVDEVATVFDVVEARRVTGSGRWRDLAPMPTARANLATAEVGGLVYAIGGIGQADNVLDVVETFDPRSGSLDHQPSPSPTPRRARSGGPGGAALCGRGRGPAGCRHLRDHELGACLRPQAEHLEVGRADAHRSDEAQAGGVGPLSVRHWWGGPPERG